MKVVLIGAFGFAGALARYGLDMLVGGRAGEEFPWGTFVVNVTGCFALGLLFAAVVERSSLSPELRTGLTVGFLGAYTTFSTFGLEAVQLAEDGAAGTAAAYVAVSVLAGIAAAFAGLRLGRLF